MTATPKVSFDYKLANLFFLCCLFPFISIFPIGSDVQPTAASVALGFYLLKVFKTGRISRVSLLLTLVAVFSFLYFDPFVAINFEPGKLFALLCALITFTFIKRYLEWFSPRLFSLAISIYFVLSVLFLMFPSQLVAFQSLLVRKMNVTEFGYRGISTLSTEPGLFGGLLVGFMALNIYFFYSNRIAKAPYIINFLQLFIMIALTKSGTGLAYLLMFSMAFLVLRRFNVKGFLKVFLVFFFLTGVLFSSLTKNLDIGKLGRGVDTFVKLTTQPELLIRDRSIVYRLYAVYVSYLSLLESPFGVGHGNVEFESQRIIEGQPALNFFYSSYGEKFHPVSSFGFYLTAYGVLFLMPLVYVLISSRAPPSFKVLALVYMLFSYSFAFPMTWLLLTISLKGRQNKGSE